MTIQLVFGGAAMNTIAQIAAALGDRNRIERELGGGGMSRVFLATETALGREIVIIVLATELMATWAVERFARDVQLAARLQHANIVPVLTAGDVQDVAYYIKPDNILLSGGAAFAADIGIAKAISASRTRDGQPPRSEVAARTQVGSSIGTPAYFAAEQAVGESIGHRADRYAWGVVVYELLAGQHPFAGKTSSSQRIVACIAETPTPLAVHAPDVPRDIAALVCIAAKWSPRNALRTPLRCSRISRTLSQQPPTSRQRRGARFVRCARCARCGSNSHFQLSRRWH